ncbi:MAG: DedA family protein [Candidatus Saccharimonadales bacterium]
MLFGLDLVEVIRAAGVLGVAAIIFAESGLLIGFFLPGDTLLFTTGFLASQGVLSIDVHLLVAILFVAAVAGDNIGYTFGRRVGRRLFRKPDSMLFHQENLQKAEAFYERFGAITIVLARFVPIVRTFAPIVAGVGKMSYPVFLTYNIAGGLLWTAGITYLGFYGGALLQANGIDVESLIFPAVGLAVLITLASPIYHIIREPKSRRIMLQKLGFKPRGQR